MRIEKKKRRLSAVKKSKQPWSDGRRIAVRLKGTNVDHASDALATILKTTKKENISLLDDFCDNCEEDSVVKWLSGEYDGVAASVLVHRLWSLVRMIVMEGNRLSNERFVKRIVDSLIEQPLVGRLAGISTGADAELRSVGLDILKHALSANPTLADTMFDALQPHLHKFTFRYFNTKKKDISSIKHDGTFESAVEFWLALMWSSDESQLTSVGIKLLEQHEFLSSLISTCFVNLDSAELLALCEILTKSIVLSPSAKSTKVKVFNFRTLSILLQVFDRPDVTPDTLTEVVSFLHTLCSRIKFVDEHYGMDTLAKAEDRSCRNPLILTVVKTLLRRLDSHPEMVGRATVDILLDCPDLVPAFMQSCTDVLLDPSAVGRFGTLCSVLQLWLCDPRLDQVVCGAMSLTPAKAERYVCLAAGVHSSGLPLEAWLKRKTSHVIALLLELSASSIACVDRLCESFGKTAEFKGRVRNIVMRAFPSIPFMIPRLQACLQPENGVPTSRLLAGIFGFLRAYTELDANRLYTSVCSEFAIKIADSCSSSLNSAAVEECVNLLLLSNDGEWSRSLSELVLSQFESPSLVECILRVLCSSCTQLKGLSPTVFVMFSLLGTSIATSFLASTLGTRLPVFDVEGVDNILSVISAAEDTSGKEYADVLHSSLLEHLQSNYAEDTKNQFVLGVPGLLVGIAHDRTGILTTAWMSKLTQELFLKGSCIRESRLWKNLVEAPTGRKLVGLGAILECLGADYFHDRESVALQVVCDILVSLPAPVAVDFVSDCGECHSSWILKSMLKCDQLPLDDRPDIGEVLRIVTKNCANICSLIPAMDSVCLTTMSYFLDQMPSRTLLEIVAGFGQEELSVKGTSGGTIRDIVELLLKRPEADDMLGEMLSSVPIPRFFEGFLKVYPKSLSCRSWCEVIERLFDVGPEREDYSALLSVLNANKDARKALRAILTNFEPARTPSLLQLRFLAFLCKWSSSKGLLVCCSSFSGCLMDPSYWSDLTFANLLEVVPLLDLQLQLAAEATKHPKQIKKVVRMMVTEGSLNDLGSLIRGNPSGFDQLLDLVASLKDLNTQTLLFALSTWKIVGASQATAKYSKAVAEHAAAAEEIDFLCCLCIDILKNGRNNQEQMDIVASLVARFGTIPTMKASEAIAFVMRMDYFLDVFMANEFPRLKLCLSEIMEGIIAPNASSPGLVTEKYLTIFLGAYTGTMSSTDCAIFRLICLASENGVDFSRISPVTFGPKSVVHYSQLHKGGAALWSRPKFAEVLDCMNSELLWKSAVEFPADVEISGSRDGVAKHRDLYDPRFVLPLLAHLLDPAKVICCVRFITHNCLAYVLAAISSPKPSVRALGYLALFRYRDQVKSSLIHQKKLLFRFLSVIRNSVTEENKRWPKVLTTFLAKCARLLVAKDESCPPSLARRLVGYVTLSPAFDMTSLPMFYELFQNDTLDCRGHRMFLLDLLDHGLRDAHSYQILQRNAGMHHLLAYFASPIASQSEKMKFLSILRNLASIPSASSDLVHNQGFPTWLLSSMPLFQKFHIHVLHLVGDLWRCQSKVLLQRCSLSNAIVSQFVALCVKYCRIAPSDQLGLASKAEVCDLLLDIAKTAEMSGLSAIRLPGDFWSAVLCSNDSCHRGQECDAVASILALRAKLLPGV